MFQKYKLFGIACLKVSGDGLRMFIFWHSVAQKIFK